MRIYGSLTNKYKKYNIMTTPEIKPRKTESYTCTQSRYEHVDSVPFRGLLLGPSGSGKRTLLQ